ncbi:MAG: hypothetical protein ACT4PT_05925 [Methanobacteriota archaeon]
MEPEEEPDAAHEARELKVRLPLSYHLRLHRIKVVNRKRMADVVREALDLYFERFPDSSLADPDAQPRGPMP